MNPLFELRDNLRATGQLKLRYQWLTWLVGSCGVGLGIFAWYHISIALAAHFEAPLDAPAMDIFGMWGLLYLVLSIPLFIGVAGASVAAVFGLLFASAGLMRFADVAGYALVSRYPRHWFGRASGA